ncbi:MAG: hypothetical protein WD556_04605 [Actinomycetota bacterium]
MEFGVERGDLRDDVDVETIASVLDWTMIDFAMSLAYEDFDAGLVRARSRRSGGREGLIEDVLELFSSGAASGAVPVRGSEASGSSA